ncbi:MAG: TonB-dependent receptor [Bacteroidales bacterium]|nr:TonB-dependent receptor [Bacteroidales bacterium]
MQDNTHFLLLSRSTESIGSGVSDRLACRFHTHNISQTPPAIDPDKELMFHLHTGSSQIQFRLTPDTSWELYGGVSFMMQNNGIGGYGFLIPSYKRQEGGAYMLANYRHSSVLQLSGSIRYDLGHIHSQQHGEDVSEVDKAFHDYSMSWGVEYKPGYRDVLRASVGRAFRLPSVNELTSNGVHHGAFRHEMGDSSLVGEHGWQVDLSYTSKRGRIEYSLSPFYSYYSHFIALHPTGRWSMLPDAGQIYQYVDAPTTFIGGEVSFNVRLWRGLHYSLTGEYVYTFDHHSHTATPYSPPANMHNTLSWESLRWRCYAECQSVAAQHRVCHNEMETNGYNIFNIGGSVDIALHQRKLSLMLNIRNLFDTSYFNHLSFYRRIELPEAGIDIQTTIRLNY